MARKSNWRLGLLFFALPCASYAQDVKPPDANALLAQADDHANAFTDQELDLTMLLKDSSGATKEFQLKTWQKKGGRRLVRFLSPGNVKGLGVLVLDKDNMYVYLPQFKKSRRIAGHARGQGFQGSDFTERDMSIVRFSDEFDATMAAENESEYMLTLAPKAGRDCDYHHAVAAIGKKNGFVTKIEFYGDEKTLLKTQTRGEFKTIDSYFTPTVITMTDHKRNHSTIMTVRNLRQNPGISDSFFAKKTLELGE